MDVKVAAQHMLNHMHHESEKLGISTVPIRDEKGMTENHCHWMLQEIIDGNIEGEKAHRWLGYTQGALVLLGEINLSQCKLINKAS